VYGLHVTEVLYAAFWILPYFNKPRSARVTVVWLLIFEALVWLIDYWMYYTNAHAWGLMLHTTWIPAVYIAAMFLAALVVPRLTRDAPRLPERLTAGGLAH